MIHALFVQFEYFVWLFVALWMLICVCVRVRVNVSVFTRHRVLCETAFNFVGVLIWTRDFRTENLGLSLITAYLLPNSSCVICLWLPFVVAAVYHTDAFLLRGMSACVCVCVHFFACSLVESFFRNSADDSYTKLQIKEDAGMRKRNREKEGERQSSSLSYQLFGELQNIHSELTELLIQNKSHNFDDKCSIFFIFSVIAMVLI